MASEGRLFTVPDAEWRLSALGSAEGSTADDDPPVRFGVEGSRYWTLGLGVAHNFAGAWDYNVRGAYSTFLIDDVEFSVELNGWYFANDGDVFAINPATVVRWHILNPEGQEWSVFLDAGIGILLATREVPRGGTRLDFTPRVGVGYTQQISDDGKRLQLGLRWHHISNARISGDRRNPSRDGLMLYGGVMVPF